MHRPMDLKRLAHLVTLADERHFARAAERVHLSQPAFSRSIQAIERELGLQLFDRSAGDVKPTPAGAFLIERARRLLFDARSLQRDALLYRDNALGDAAFGAGPFPAATIMPRVLATLRAAYPGVSLRLEANNWQLLLQRLLAEDIEFFVADIRDIPADPKIEVSPIGRQRARLFVRKSHPLARKRCSFAQAWQHGVAATRLPSAMKALLAQLVGLPAGEDVVPALECDDVALLRAIALSTDTAIAASEAAVADDVKRGALVALQIRDLPAVYAEMGIVTLAKRTPSPMAQRAMACVREVAAQVNGAPQPSTAGQSRAS